MDTGSVDMAKTMAEVFAKGDANKDEKLNKQEFINVSCLFYLYFIRKMILKMTHITFSGNDKPSNNGKDPLCEDYRWSPWNILSWIWVKNLLEASWDVWNRDTVLLFIWTIW